MYKDVSGLFNGELQPAPKRPGTRFKRSGGNNYERRITMVVQADWHQHPLDDEQLIAFRNMGVEVLQLVTHTLTEFLEVAGEADAILSSDFRISAEATG